jgi:hypothetical protein
MSDYVICENHNSLTCENEWCAHKKAHPHIPSCCSTTCTIYNPNTFARAASMVARCVRRYDPVILPRELFEI